MEQKCIQNVWCERLIHQRNIKKFHGIASQKLSCIDQKYEKWMPKWKRDYVLQKPVSHISIWLGKRECDLLNWNVWCSKSQRLNHNVEISKISSTDLKKRCIIQKGSNVINYAEAKWKASNFCNHSLVGGHICSFL